MGNRFYLLMVGLGCGGFVVFFLLMSMRMEAFSGSGTRLGGYLEANYGWNEPQAAFTEPGFTKFESLAEYRRGVDVIVIGDSFVEDERIGWVNYLAYDYGLSAIVFHIDKLSIPALLNHPVFIESPPKYFLLTSNEGLSIARFAKNNLDGVSSPISYGAAENRTRHASPNGGTRDLLFREKAMNWRARMAATGDWIKKRLRRALLGPNSLPVMELPIECASCFSNKRGDSLLVMRSTVAPSAYPVETVERAVTQLTRLREHIEGNGYTEFRTVVFPSKIAVYSRYVPSVAASNLINEVLKRAAINYVDLLPSLRAAVTGGARDVYLPNDHHMGANGYAIAARAIARSLNLLE